MSAFSLRLRTRQGCPISPVLFNIIPEVLASSVTGEKRKKRGGGGGEWKRNESYADWKGRDNSAYIHKWHDYLCIMSQSQSIYKKLLLLINVEKENGNPLQYSCLENPMDRGAWQSTVHGITQSQTWLKQLSTLINMSLENLKDTNSTISIIFLY